MIFVVSKAKNDQHLRQSFDDISRSDESVLFVLILVEDVPEEVLWIVLHFIEAARSTVILVAIGIREAKATKNVLHSNDHVVVQSHRRISEELICLVVNKHQMDRLDDVLSLLDVKT